jgi:hypothetical protein
MKHRAAYVCLLLSALLATTVVVLWVRSYFAEDVVLFPFGRHACGVYSASGQLLVRFGGFPYTISRDHGVRFLREPATCFDDGGPAGALIGFDCFRYDQPPGVALIFPHWFIAAPAAALPTIVALRRRRRRVAQRGAFPVRARTPLPPV